MSVFGGKADPTFSLGDATDCAVTHVEGAGDFGQRFASLTAFHRFTALMLLQLGRAPHVHAGRLSPRPTLAGTLSFKYEG
jgi:hypothetical protein